MRLLFRIASMIALAPAAWATDAARGANTLVLRGHEATFFTKARYRSPRPVHVRLHAAAIRIHQPAACRLDTLAPQALQRRAIEGEALNVIADPGAPTT